MGTTVRQGSKTMYYLDTAQAKSQPALGGGGGIVCVPVENAAGRSRKTVYRMAPSQIQGARVLTPVPGATLAPGLQCDSCPPLCRLQQVSMEDVRYGGAVASGNEPQILRVVPKGKNIYVEEVKQMPQRSSKSRRKQLPTVMQLVDDGNWYDKVVPESSESEAVAEPETCLECLEELMRRRRGLDPEPAASPVYMSRKPSSKRASCSRRLVKPSPAHRASSRGTSPASAPRCPTCTACKSCGTMGAELKPNTTKSRSRKWYE
ncbi:hypothetical protein V5799_030721 [Amblyomma americanum]|uniref:Uncharacterized protein n=1 Tax=Amblyomma americanum TaxID=6943 RepID=A0AAQ4EME7_AMBAM